jgi:magnesium transporter
MPTTEAPTAELIYLLAGDPAELMEVLSRMRPPDIVERLNELSVDAAGRVLGGLPLDMAVQIFDEPDLERREELIRELQPAAAAAVLEAMSPDEQTDLVRELGDAERARLLRTLSGPVRQRLTELLRYPEESAGGFMTTEFVSVPAAWTVDETLRHISRVGRAKETVYAIYVLDARDRLVHIVSLRDLVMAERTQRVDRIGDRQPLITVHPLADREEVARTISKYDLLAMPVVDDDRHVLGIVTVDDVIDALIEEVTEDVHKLGGMEALDAPYLETGFFSMIRKRGGWLFVLFLGEMLTATAMAYFEDEIAAAVVLATFIPLIISSGGNSGSQATTLVIRALALGELRAPDWWRVVRREMAAGLTLGLLLGVVGFFRIAVWEAIGGMYGPHYHLVGLTVAGSLVGVVLFGTVAGSMLPFLLRAARFDPASASAPLVATVVDVTGVLIYFTIASSLLRGTLL